jgi:hypothetical protein
VENVHRHRESVVAMDGLSESNAMGPSVGLAICLAVAISALVGGCGGEEDGRGGGSASSDAQFLAEANAVCERENAGLAEEVSDFVARRKAAELPRGMLYAALAHTVLLPRVERQLEAIRALGLPRGEEERIGEMLFAEQIAIDELATSARIRAFAAIEREFAESARMLRAYGLTSCVNGPPAWRQGLAEVGMRAVEDDARQ